MRLFLGIFLLIVMAGCSKVEISQYAENKPELDIFSYFAGKTTGWGVVQNRGGKLLRQFKVTIYGSFPDENTMVLDEDFVWSDGEESKRIWTIRKTDEGTYEGTADDVVGIAQGISSGNALHWQYHLNLETEGSTWKIYFDDWMFLQPDQIIINRASMSKFGIHLGDITIAFSKD
ncbi:MAG: DUF3833 domain-containing protein [Desulfofustis sp.]|nr:DUF3833 domain-containing protein [Desulfofustis sp.]NNF46617.1 DUF3833 domain-containing protein [Desulfofustis sp.]NNK55860.1 DUF3833 domain-containing protein [Desulfofustis sp.]